MKRLLLALLALFMLSSAALCEEMEEEAYDWREDWEEAGYLELCDVREDTLIVFEGVEALGEARTSYWDDELEEDVEIAPRFESGLRFEYMMGPDFHQVSLPSTLRYLGMEAFYCYQFSSFTLPAQLEGLESDAFVYCGFDVLRIESVLPAEEILDSLYDCSVTAYDVPADHPLYKTVDGVLFTKDGKTLLSYPNARRDTHYDVPAGVERIEGGAFGNESLQTVSLPIGLKSIGDFGFSGCTRLQSIALPLTVREIGVDVFYRCVSLELVSLPEGLDADKDTDGDWAAYYEDDALYRGDNGDTLGGSRSEGRINAPGRLRRSLEKKEKNSYMKDHVEIYDSADAPSSRRYYRNGKTVYMGGYQNGRVALYEPLGGIVSRSDGYGSVIGWADIADVRYLNPEALFAYAQVNPKSRMRVWWNHLPDYASWTPWETIIPEDGTYEAALFGAYVRFYDTASRAVFACAIQDAELTRKGDGTDNRYGIVYNEEFMKDIPLLEAADGETVKLMPGGTQVQILEETDCWYRVSDGQDTGWVQKDQVKIIPEEQEGNEE